MNAFNLVLVALLFQHVVAVRVRRGHQKGLRSAKIRSREPFSGVVTGIVRLAIPGLRVQYVAPVFVQCTAISGFGAALYAAAG